MRTFFLFCCCLFTAAIAAAETKVAVLTIEEVFGKANFFIAAQAGLEKEIVPVQQKIEGLQTEVKNKQALLRTLTPNDPKRITYQQDIEVLKFKLKMQYEGNKKRLETLELQTLSKAYGLIREQLENFRKEQGYDFILRSAPKGIVSKNPLEVHMELGTHMLLSSAPEHNCTAAFITYLNDNLKPDAMAPKPAEPTKQSSAPAIEIPSEDAKPAPVAK